MPQIHIDENAKRILEAEKGRLIAKGIAGASLGDAIRSMNTRLFEAETYLKIFREEYAKDTDHQKRPRGTAGGA